MLKMIVVETSGLFRDIAVSMLRSRLNELQYRRIARLMKLSRLVEENCKKNIRRHTENPVAVLSGGSGKSVH